jgi:hypothetical protein
MKTIAGFPYWELEFDSVGKETTQSFASKCIEEASKQRIADLFIFSHGWNNDRTAARSLYERFFEVIRRILTARRVSAPLGSAVGIVGVLWPSILFPDDQPQTSSGGAAALLDASGSTNVFVELKKVFPNETVTLEKLELLLAEQPESIDELMRFQALLTDLAPALSTDEGSDESGIMRLGWEKVFTRLSTLAPPAARDGAATLDSGFKRLWTGAKEALRVTTYWNMKERAGVVGERGLGPFIAALRQEYEVVAGSSPALHIHLIGHSFGARLVAFTLKGLPPQFDTESSPIKSMTLLQGAFSHFAFAESLPHDDSRSGALAGLQSRVDGPIVVTHSKRDLAVIKRYPQASLLSDDDAAAFKMLNYRFGGMGADGAQNVNATEEWFKAVGQPYRLLKGQFINLNGDDLITKGSPPSGAHGDIFYEEIAWAVLLASKLATAEKISPPS